MNTADQLEKEAEDPAGAHPSDFNEWVGGWHTYVVRFSERVRIRYTATRCYWWFVFLLAMETQEVRHDKVYTKTNSHSLRFRLERRALH